VRYLFGVSILIFIINKFIFRPWAIENEFSPVWLIIAFSIPNLIEAVAGTLLLTGILFQLREFFFKQMGKLKDAHLYLMATGISSLYVVSQELKFHNLGGQNTYDIYDLFASFAGLILTYIIITTFGFADRIKNN